MCSPTLLGRLQSVWHGMVAAGKNDGGTLEVCNIAGVGWGLAFSERVAAVLEFGLRKLVCMSGLQLSSPCITLFSFGECMPAVAVVASIDSPALAPWVLGPWRTTTAGSHSHLSDVIRVVHSLGLWLGVFVLSVDMVGLKLPQPSLLSARVAGMCHHTQLTCQSSPWLYWLIHVILCVYDTYLWVQMDGTQHL